MAEVTKEQHDRIMLKIGQSAERIRLCGVSIDEATKVFAALAEVARKVDFPPLKEIARMRMDLMRQEYGIARFVMPEWWRWLWMSVAPNAQDQPGRTG